jgi:hypothetical protein
LNEIGIIAEPVWDEFPSLENSKYIFVPHEWFKFSDGKALPSRHHLSKSIAFITENPNTPWFTESTKFQDLFPQFLFMNKKAELLYPVEKKRKTHFQLFNVGDDYDFDEIEWKNREYDFAFIGGYDESRAAGLAKLAPMLSSRKCFISIPPTTHAPIAKVHQTDIQDFVHRVKNSKVLINLHRSNSESIEWHRVLKANHFGAVVISESIEVLEKSKSSNLLKEFESTEDFVRLTSNTHSLHSFAKEAKIASQRLISDNNSWEISKFLFKRKSRYFLFIPFSVRHPIKSIAIRLKKFLHRVSILINTSKYKIPEYWHLFHVIEQLQRGQKKLVLDNIEMKRYLVQRAGIENVNGKEFDVIVDKLRETIPDVTVGITVYKEKHLIIKALESLLEIETGKVFDILISSDAGDQETIDLACDFLSKTNLSYKVLKRLDNGGAGANRNTLLRNSRSRYFLALDGDNSLFPKGLDLLYDALNQNTSACFSYGLLAIESKGELIDISGNMNWDVAAFREIGNYIDALALLNIEKVLDLGGYSEDLLLHGWEDFDLWCRVANSGGVGIQVKNFVAIYRRRVNSMISITNLYTKDALDLIAERSPNLFKKDLSDPELSAHAR